MTVGWITEETISLALKSCSGWWLLLICVWCSILGAALCTTILAATRTSGTITSLPWTVWIRASLHSVRPVTGVSFCVPCQTWRTVEWHRFDATQTWYASVELVTIVLVRIESFVSTLILSRLCLRLCLWLWLRLLWTEIKVWAWLVFARSPLFFFWRF